MGIWDKPKPVNEAGSITWPEDWSDFQSLDILKESERAFKLHGVRVRKAETKFGMNLSVDAAVSLPGSDSLEFFSGFSAGIAVMAKEAVDSDFPVWVRCESKDTGKGNPTTILVPVSSEDVQSLESGTEDDIPF